MEGQRLKTAKGNIALSLVYQLVLIASGIIVPKMMLSYFGSEVYGAAVSVERFLGYITLFEGGIASVARAAFYKPLAENSAERISAVYNEIRRYFHIVGFVLLAYTLILACGIRELSQFKTLDGISTFALVIVISISSFAQYFLGMPNTILLQAAQRSYIIYSINTAAAVLNAIAMIVLMKLGCSVIVVKLVSSFIFAARPALQRAYIKKRYALDPPVRQKDTLKNKWTGTGQHVAGVIHDRTDVAVLTLFGDLLLVAVYSVYSMVTYAVESIVLSFSAGMEALFGDMYAKNELTLLNKTFGEYETMLSCAATVFFSATIVLISPFVRLYTSGVTDADYYQPIFGTVMAVSSALYSVRLPYIAMVTAAGCFRQTRWAAYGEAIVNVALSILLVIKFGLIGVAVGTVCAIAFRFAYYAVFLSRNVLHRRLGLWIKRTAVNTGLILVIVLIGKKLIGAAPIGDYFAWGKYGVVVTAIAAGVTLLGNLTFYREDTRCVLRRAGKLLRISRKPTAGH